MKRIEIMGNVVRDVEINMDKEGRSALNFTIAVNSAHREGNRLIDKAMYFKCVIWKAAGASTKIADRLRQGALVWLDGNFSLDIYAPVGKKPVCTIKITVGDIEIFNTPASMKSRNVSTTTATTNSDAVQEENEIESMPSRFGNDEEID